MKNSKTKIEYKPKESKYWEKFVNGAINNLKLNASFFPSDGEIYIPIEDENMWSLVIKKDGTWNLQ
ncbi:hypothetical protein M0R04_10085 [Candidatus Dojkabacteria bacterium]|jgi:hypothetical protein|nr:hypothetical protein [Candidatus Dojkabacteria bacterium]